MLSAKPKGKTIEVLISKGLIDWYINHGKFISVSNVLREYNETEEQVKNPTNVVKYTV